MREVVSFGGEIQSVSDAQIPVVSAAALYGFGVFTTIAIYNRKPFLWHLHQKRLQNHAAKIGLNASEIDFEQVENSLLKLIAANNIERGRARVTFFDSSASDVWRFETTRKTEVLIIATENLRNYKDSLRLTISPFRVNSTSALAGVKSCNYAENLLALNRAKAAGFDEAVRLNERGEIVSATMANLFWTKDATVFTPAPETGALAGTTREFVFEQAKQLGFTVSETVASLTDLESADEMFLTSAGLGVCAAKKFNKKGFDSIFLTSKLRLILLEKAYA